MLNRAVQERKRKERNKAKHSILLVDADRSKCGDDGWLLSQLKQQASTYNIIVCAQDPNQEGLLLRMMPGKQHLKPNATNTQRQLRTIWQDYQKPVDAQTLASKFSVEDLLRAASCDTELDNLLSRVGLMHLKLSK